MSIGSNLRRIREAQGITQAQLAENLGYSQPLINSYEQDTKAIPLQRAKQISTILHCTIDDLVSEEVQ